ncbi:hypothetical protein SAMN05216490_0906 [Mucilaginibacter mallensis]|uniref:Lipocalin-like domain-containing protein n=1 Tax=Mucilaginibacter mallensis TaxID=652787 RepID=A0A1H1R319_MUCMA|nr:lipocalin family protein [Mucilaginibacter mallensis]SDS30072.1 hypothetical protein SAMN05216490_0906 [Mucilaginibacter mallensis]
MKKFPLYTILTVIIFFISCKKDSNSVNKASIIGKWYWVEQTYTSYTNNVLTSTQDYTTTLDPTSYFEFDANGVFIEKPQDSMNVLDSGQYHIAGDSLYLKRNIDTRTTSYDIKKLTSTSLVIYSFSNEPPYSGSLEYTMKR